MSVFDKVVQVKDLTSAAIYFLDRYNGDLSSISNIKRTKTLESKIEVMNKKYFDKEYAATEKDNEYGIPVQQQEGKRYHFQDKKDKMNNRKTCIILSKEIDSNPLGIEDYYYFYILYRKKTLTSWSSQLNMSKKFCRVPGFYIPFSVLKHIDNNKVKETSEIVFVLADPEKGIQTRIYSAKSSNIFSYFLKNKMPLMINRWGEMVTGIPLDELSSDIYK